MIPNLTKSLHNKFDEEDYKSTFNKELNFFKIVLINFSGKFNFCIPYFDVSQNIEE